MICGTFSFDGLTMHFKLPYTSDGKVVVYAQDHLTGERAKIECDPRAFAASMALAMDFDGMEGTPMCEKLYELAETIPWPNNNLRWIP